MGYPAFLQGTDTQPPEEHWELLPMELKKELTQFAASYRAPLKGDLDGPCFWFDQVSRRCRHHQHRPRVCREFQVGGRDCLAWRDAMAEFIGQISSVG